MKTIIINITHDEVFEDFKTHLLSKPPKKVSEIIIDADGIIINMLGTLEELEND
jgi:hypothetical protein